MNETLIKNWNEKVPEDGIVFILGDFCLGKFPAWESIANRLNGKKYLIKGNHDIRQNLRNEDRLNQIFDWVGSQMLIEVGNRRIYLNHYPFLCYGGTYNTEKEAIWALSGHTHICKTGNTGKDFERMKYLFPTQYDVGVDFNDLAPISFKEVKEKIEFQVANNVNLMHWVKS